MFELDDECKTILLFIKEMWSWLPPWLYGQRGCSQEHISLISNDFALFVQSSSNGGFLVASKDN